MPSESRQVAPLVADALPGGPGSPANAVLVSRQPDRRILDVNDEFCRIFRISRREALGQSTDFMYTSSEDFERLGATIARFVAQAQPTTLEWTLRRNDGSTFPAQITVVSLNVADAGHAGVVKVIRDLTPAKEQARREERRREREAFLTEASTLLLRDTLHPEETLRLAAQLGTRLLGDYASVDLLDEGRGALHRVTIAHADPAKGPLVQRYAALYPPKPELRAIIEALHPGGARVTNDVDFALVEQYATRPGELALVRELGLRHHLMVPLVGRRGLLGAMGCSRSTGEPFDDDDAQLARELAARAALAYENAVLYRRATASEERLRRILETAPVHILTVDHAGRILTVNRSVQVPDPAVLLGRSAYDAVPPDDRARVRAVIERVMRDGEPAEYEAEGIVGPGATRWFNVRVAPLPLDGETGAVLIATDIHERRRAEAEIARARAELVRGEKLAALGSLVSGVAHELRTPLTYLSNNAFIVRTRLESAAREGASAAEALQTVEPFLREVATGVDRINLLVDDLRRYTKARGERKLEVAPLGSFLTEAIDLFRAANRGVHALECVFEPTPPVRANRGALQQVALNLLQNAAEASAPGSTIRVATRPDGAGGLLEVSDEGSGVAAEIRERIFEPLFTTKPEGTGLGLSIVKRIVDEHGAVVECVSEPGRGATFRVRFPPA